MDHLKVYFKFGILVFERVQAMRRGNKDLFHPVIDKSFNVFPGQAFEQLLIARLADAFTTAVFLDTQYPEIDPGLIEDAGGGSGDLF